MSAITLSKSTPSKENLSMKKYISLLTVIALMICVAACSNKNAPQQEMIEAQGKAYKEIAADRTVRVVPEHYVGVKRMPVSVTNAPELQTKVTLRSNGSLQKIADTIMTLVPLTVNVVGDQDTGGGSNRAQLPQGRRGNNQDPTLIEELLQAKAEGEGIIPGVYNGNLSINYSGRLVGLLEQIAMQSGYGWDYNRKDKTITFARTMVRTFALHAAPGAVSYGNILTDKSKDDSGSSGEFGGNVNSTVTRNDSDTQISQTYKSQMGFDIWNDTLNTVKTLLSSIGKATSNVAAGTITVRDRPSNLRMVENFINEVNARYSLQVAMKVNVYSLDITDAREAGIDLKVMFNNSNTSRLAISAGSLTNLGLIGTASAAIISGDMKDSQAVLKALGQWGHATQVTSAGVVTMNNQPAPVEAVRRIAYLAATSQENTDYGSTTELTPGEVTTGYSMTIVPHILPNRRVILQYTVRLAALESMSEFTSGEARIQLPEVSTRAFSQKANMMMGQTLVLAGFEQAMQENNTSGGLLSFAKSGNYRRTLLVITIQLENAAPEIAEVAHAAD